MRSSTAVSPSVPPSTGHNSRSRLLVGVLAGALVSALCVWLLGSAIDARQAIELVGGADLELVLVALLPLALSMVVRTLRWRILLHSAAPSSDAGTVRLLPFVLAGYAANAVLPLRMGDVARAVTAARRLGLGLPETIGSVGLERVLDAGGLAAVALAASLGTAVPGWLIGTSLLLAGATVVFFALVHGLYRLAPRLSWVRGSMVARFGRGLRSDPRSVGVAFALSMLIWCVDAVTFWTVASALGVELGPGAAVLMATGAALGGILPSAPAAIGTFELAGTAMGTAIGLDGASALAIVMLAHATTIVPLLIGGAIAVPIIGLSGTDLRTEAPAGSAA